MKVRFGVCADVHTEFIHDAPQRMETFIKECEEKNVDFCIELGDFCPPGELNREHKEKILAMIKASPLKFYHTYGNHDTDHNSKYDVAQYVSPCNMCQSFDVGGVRFVTVDACYYQENGEYISYDKGNYIKACANALVPVIPPSETERLRRELSDGLPTVVFSHQSLVESRTGIKNAPDLRRMFDECGAKPIMAICGHEHVDRFEQIDGVYYYCLNSMSYYWAGDKYNHSTYGEEIEQNYPRLRGVFPYREPLYAIIDIEMIAKSG